MGNLFIFVFFIFRHGVAKLQVFGGIYRRWTFQGFLRTRGKFRNAESQRITRERERMCEHSFQRDGF